MKLQDFVVNLYVTLIRTQKVEFIYFEVNSLLFSQGLDDRYDWLDRRCLLLYRSVLQRLHYVRDQRRELFSVDILSLF